VSLLGDVENGFAIMAKVHTVLLPVQQGSVWRVQIVWPNGSVHYYGNFQSKKQAADWITAHDWITKTEPDERKSPASDKNPSPPSD
jgi:hypothetical protein